MTTLLWGVLFFYIIYRTHGVMRQTANSDEEWFYNGNLLEDLKLTIIYTLIHPVIGRIIASVVWWLCKGIDLLYELEGNQRWSVWNPESKLWAGVMWPITALIMLPITLIGLIYGWLYKSFFGSE